MPSKKQNAFTLVEIVVVVGIIALMIALIIPMLFIGHKRSQAGAVKHELKMLDSALHQYAVETGRSAGFKVEFSDLKKYVIKDGRLFKSGGKDLFGNSYGSFVVDAHPKVPAATYEQLNNAVDDSFWSDFH